MDTIWWIKAIGLSVFVAFFSFIWTWTIVLVIRTFLEVRAWERDLKKRYEQATKDGRPLL